MALVDHALDWAERGFRVFPLVVGGGTPVISGWQEVATTDPVVIRRVWAKGEFNIGVLTTGWCVVDVDVKNGKPGMMSLLGLDLDHDTLTVETPTGGLHLYYSGEVPNSVSKIALGIDIRGVGGYVIAPGSVRADGTRYSLANDSPVLAAPEHLIAAAGALRSRDTALLAADPDTPAALATAIEYAKHAAPSIEGAGGDDNAYRVAAKIKDFGLSEVGALEVLLDHWNERCSPPWSVEELTLKVANVYQFGTSPPGKESVEVEFAGIQIPPDEPKPESGDGWFWHGDKWTYDKQWLFYQMIPRSGVGLLTAPSQSGKTFLLNTIAEALAQGTPLFGVEPDVTGGSLILAAEGQSSIRPRLSVLGTGQPLPIASRAIGFLNTAEEVKKLVAMTDQAVEKMRATFGKDLLMLAIDTLAASGLVADENDNSEVAKAVKNLETLGKRFKCPVIVTHHPPKDSTGVRGASALFNGVDFVIEIYHTPGQTVRQVHLTKSREAPAPRRLGSFTLIPQTVGIDAHGRPIEACTVSMGDTAAPVTKTPPHFDTFMECFEWVRADDALGLGPADAVEDKDLRRAFLERKTGSKDKSNVSRAFKLCLEYAEAKKIITVQPEGEHTWLTDKA